MHSAMRRGKTITATIVARAVFAAGLAAVALATAGTGCGGPKYPKCDDDKQCNTGGHKGVCVNGKCVDCKSDDACGSGKQCVDGTCKTAEGYCDDKNPCESGKVCGSDHKCKNEMTADTTPTECDDDHPCKNPGERCQNGHCYAPPKAAGCEDFAAPKFAYESAELTDVSKATLERLAKCITGGTLKGRKVLLTGHCDARGEYEFNMGLGAHRAEAVKDALTRLGVAAAQVATSSRGKLDAVGTDENSYANDRRVDIEIR
jgi:peptidoglycan-associated lipoprotein